MIIASALLLLATAGAQADFSYTMTRRSTGGMMGAMAAQAPQTTKISLKGQKMKVDTGVSVTIMDFDAQTITSFSPAQKTFRVTLFSDIGTQAEAGGIQMKIDAQETGAKKTINGLNASELVMTMEMEAPQQAPQMGKMQMEIDSWISADVPGVQELRAFYQRNGGKFPWAAIAGGGGNPSLQQAMGEVQKKFAEMNGVPVAQTVKVKAPAAMAAMGEGRSGAQNPQMQESMAQARAKLEAMKAQGGPAAAMAAKALERMGPAPDAASSSSSSLIEMTMEAEDFSASTLSDSLFAVPDGYKKAN